MLDDGCSSTATGVWDSVIQDIPGQQRFAVRRDIFSDPQLFELELKYLFEGGWIYLAHASQLPEPHDYLTTWAGRRPVVLMRDGDGVVRAFHNSCPHKGNLICSFDQGNARVHVCPYHSWSFSSSGRLRSIKASKQGGYSDSFLSNSHDLVEIARFGEYRGFFFGSLSLATCELSEYLGEARKMIDLMVDQGPEGLEFIPGVSAFTYEGNWKHQLENCSDGYHVTSVHPTYLQVAQRRAEAANASDVAGIWERTSPFLEDRTGEAMFGTFQFEHGHVASWSASTPTPGHPLFRDMDALRARVGDTNAKWMFYSRNLTIFPNLQIADNFSSQVRVLRPLAPGRTEMTTYCIGPRGEAPMARRQRLRQYEDFFMPSGMATPDDLVIYENCQQTAVAASDSWQSYERGMAVQREGANEDAQDLGMSTTRSVRGAGQLWDETLMHSYYRAWRERIGEGVHRDSGTAAA